MDPIYWSERTCHRPPAAEAGEENQFYPFILLSSYQCGRLTIYQTVHSYQPDPHREHDSKLLCISRLHEHTTRWNLPSRKDGRLSSRQKQRFLRHRWVSGGEHRCILRRRSGHRFIHVRLIRNREPILQTSRFSIFRLGRDDQRFHIFTAIYRSFMAIADPNDISVNNRNVWNGIHQIQKIKQQKYLLQK